MKSLQKLHQGSIFHVTIVMQSSMQLQELVGRYFGQGLDQLPAHDLEQQRSMIGLNATVAGDGQGNAIAPVKTGIASNVTKSHSFSHKLNVLGY